MSDHKDIRRFAELEKELKLFERTYAGEPYWQHIRFFVCEDSLTERYRNQNSRQKQERTPVRKAKEIALRTFALVKDAFFILHPGHCDLLIIKNERLKDRFYDYWKVPQSISTITCRFYPLPGEMSVGERYFSLPLFQYKVLNKLSKALHIEKTDESEDLFLKELEETLKREFGKSTTWENMKRLINSDRIRNHCYGRYFDRLLDRTKAKAMLVTVYYKEDVFLPYRIAKEKGVRVIELQHGVINNHEEYYFEDDSGVNNDTPDYLLTFGDIHNAWTRLVKGSRTVSVGYPYQEYVINHQKLITTDDKLIVVYPVREPGFEAIINEFSEKILEFGYRILVKIHPDEANNYKKLYPFLAANEKITLITSQKEGIYHWLKIAKHHVMTSTTVGLEAMAFDHTNVCIALGFPHEQTQCLLDWGVARGFSNVDELVTLILEPIPFDQEKIDVRNRLWKKNAADHIQHFFSELKDNGWNDLPEGDLGL